MRHLKEYHIFESDEHIDLKKINRDPTILNWLYKNEDQPPSDPFEEFEVKNPYGGTAKIKFDDSYDWEYTGEGDWVASVSHEEDGITYQMRGTVSGSYGYPEDEPGNWEDPLEIEISDPIHVFNRTIKSDPLIASKIYSLLPESIKKDLMTLMSERGMEKEIIELLKGSNLLNRFE